MNARAKHFFILFLISLAIFLLLLVNGFIASTHNFLGGIGYVFIAYFVGLLTLVFFGLAVVNMFSHSQNQEHPNRDVSALAGVIGLLLFGVGRLPLRWYVVYGAGWPGTLSFLGVLLMAISVFEIIRKHFRKT